MAKTWVAAARIASVTGRLLKSELEIPREFKSVRVSELQGVPLEAATPAELTWKSLRSETALRKSPSAMGLRQVFPVQTKSTCFWSDIGGTVGKSD